MSTTNSSETAEAVTREAILAQLDALGGLTVQEDTLTFEGSRFVLPESMRGRVRDAVRYLKDWEQQQEETYSYSREYLYRPDDGAAAFDRTMKRLFGSTGVGVAQVSFFGSQPPELRTIHIGPHETVQVPWGEVRFSPLDATFYTGAGRSREHGTVFVLGVEAPRKHRRRIEGFFDAVERELRENSIFRGKAINGADEPGFIDVSTVDPTTVVYSADVMTQLQANLWGLLDHTDLMRELHIPLKRAVLVEGPYGTGKTLAGALTAQRAVANGWTFVLNRPGQDDLLTTLRTAQLYAPAVVWFEDIDTIGASDGNSSMFVSRLLDALDGVTAKGVEVVAGFTTNHVDRLQKGLLRPGRIDTVIHIGELDAAGVEKLVRVRIPAQHLGTVDYARIATAFTGYVPAFASEAIDRAMRYAIARTGGRLDEVTTDDLVNAAQGLRAQHAIMESASEGSPRATVDTALAGVVEDILGRTRVYQAIDEPFVVEATNPATSGVDA
jgi:hypothetical protein